MEVFGFNWNDRRCLNNLAGNFELVYRVKTAGTLKHLYWLGIESGLVMNRPSIENMFQIRLVSQTHPPTIFGSLAGYTYFFINLHKLYFFPNYHKVSTFLIKKTNFFHKPNWINISNLIRRVNWFFFSSAIC